MDLKQYFDDDQIAQARQWWDEAEFSEQFQVRTLVRENMDQECVPGEVDFDELTEEGKYAVCCYVHKSGALPRYELTYRTKKGTAMCKRLHDGAKAEEELTNLFQRRIEAELKKDGVEIGEVWYTDRANTRKWHWRLDEEALGKS